MSTEKELHSRASSLRTALLLLSVLLAAQWLTGAAIAASDGASVSFSLDFPNSSPEHYEILVQSDGQTRYVSSGRISQDSDVRDDYEMSFTLSEATRARIFELAEKAHYFSGKVDSGNKKLAFTGAKKLVYKDDTRSSSAEYNYSTQPVVQQLTTLFQSVGATLEFGRRLTYYHRYQKLALDDETKRMEDQARSGELAEVKAVAPILQKIYDDTSVMKVVRARALRILQMPPVPSRN